MPEEDQKLRSILIIKGGPNGATYSAILVEGGKVAFMKLGLSFEDVIDPNIFEAWLKDGCKEFLEKTPNHPLSQPTDLHIFPGTEDVI